MFSATSSPNHTWLECLSTSTCCSLITMTKMVRTSVSSRSFSICFQMFWTYFQVSSPQNPISAAHCLAVNFFRPVAESPAISPFVFIAVIAPSTKNLLACDTDNDAAVITAYPAFIWGAATLCDSGHFPIVPSSRSFCQVFNFWDGRVTTLMSVSVALVSSFLPFTQRHISHSKIVRTRRFTSLSFGSTHDIKILCNSPDIFCGE